MPFLFWIDGDQHRYLALTYGLFYVFAALAVVPFFSPPLDRRLRSRWGATLFLSLAALVMLAGRWPTFFVREELNIDEAGMLALANQMVRFPVPWVDYDPQTVGPLDALVLDAPRLIGLTPGWISTRIVAIGVWLAALGGLYATVALLFEARIARLALVPVVLFATTVYLRDFLHYSSELTPMALAMWAVYCLMLAARGRSRGLPVFGCALSAGALPFAKLQAAPIALTLLGLLVLLVAGFRDADRLAKLRLSIVALIGAGAVPAACLIPVAAHRALHDFWISYVLSGANYIWHATIPPAFVLGSPEFSPYFDAAALVALPGLVLAASMWRTLGGAQRIAPFVFAAILVAALVAIYTPHHGSPHYLLFAVFPVACCAALTLGYASVAIARVASFERRAFAAETLAFAFLFASCAALPWLPHDSPYIGWLGYERDKPLDPAAAAVDYWIGPGKRVAIWGWAPNQWVHSRTLMGTRDLLCQHQIDPGPYRDYYRLRYLNDFLANEPDGFLDAVTPDSFGYYDKTTDGFETFPALAGAIARDYRLVAIVGKGYGVYVRRDLRNRPGDGRRISD